MAETYGVYDWRRLPLVTAATLAQGLPQTSRTVKKLVDRRTVDDETVLLAIIADRLGHIAWMWTEDGQKGRNHPPSVLSALMRSEETERSGFDSGPDFEAAWAAITGTGGDDNA